MDKAKRSAIIIAVLALAALGGSIPCSTPATAADPHCKTFKACQTLADSGDAQAQHIMGDMYYAGFNPPEQDYAKAFAWYRKAADQGDLSAQHNVGHMYEKGLGVEKDIDRALEWYKKSEKILDSYFRYGLVSSAYTEDEAVKKEGTARIINAAKQGHKEAQVVLALAYYKDDAFIGIKKNYIEGYAWGVAAQDEKVIALFAKEMGEDGITAGKKLGQDYYELYTAPHTQN